MGLKIQNWSVRVCDTSALCISKFFNLEIRNFNFYSPVSLQFIKEISYLE